MNSNPKLTELNESLRLTNELLQSYGMHLASISSSLEQIAIDLNRITTTRAFYDRREVPGDAGNPHSD